MKGIALAIVASLLAGASVAQAPRSLADLQSAARTGEPSAQFELGEAYRTGAGTPVDRDQAIMWFKRAADQGSQPARDALGMLLFTRGNRQEAMPLIEAAAARGDARALYILATARFNGDYVARDWPRAYAEMSRAAELGLPQARASLTQMEPYLLPADRAKADEIRATMAAAAPRGSTPPLSAAPVPNRVAAAPAPTPAPSPSRDDGLGLPTVPADGASGTSFTLAPSTGTAAPLTGTSPRAPSPPPVVAPAAAAPSVAPVADVPPAPPRATIRSASIATVASSPARGTWRIQLGAYSSKDRADAQWTILAGRYPTLARHTHTVTPAGAVFRLQAEQIAGREEAGALCRDVVAGGGGCFAVAP